MQINRTVVLAVAAAVTWAALPAANADNGLHRGDVYSTAAVNRVCKEAQKIVGGTSVDSINIIWDDAAGFIASDAAPYAVTGEDLPLTTHQYVSYGVYPDTGNRQFPVVISCKLKAGDDILKFVDPNANPPPGPPPGPPPFEFNICNQVIEDTLQRVDDSLTHRELDFVVDTDLALDVGSDDAQMSGQAWTIPLPPTLACLGTDGLLHVRAKSLPVPNTFFPWPFPFPEPPGWGPEKTGVNYCHLPAAEYLRELLTGNLQAPACP